MAVQFAQPYRFSEQQLARMAQACLVPAKGTELIDGVPYRAGAPIRFSNDDYQRLGEIGVIGEDERVELIDGEVIQMTPIGGQHQTVVFDAADYLHSVAVPGLRVATGAIKLEATEPVPDLMVLRRADEVHGKLPGPSACLLVVEVSDTSASYDRSGKRELYARGGIAEYWVVDLNTQTVVLHLCPVAGDYQKVTEHPRGSAFVSPALGGMECVSATCCGSGPQSNTRSRDGRKGRMAVQFAQPYRFSEQQLARMAQADIVPEHGTELIDGVPYWAGAPFRFSSEDYFRLGELGVLREGDRVELVDGEVIEMSPEDSRHSACIRRMIRYLPTRVGEAIVGAQDSLSLPDEYWPKPDVVVLRPDAEEYENVSATFRDALVVVEVANSSVHHDRFFKASRYAEAEIPEYWLVDLTRDVITVHRRPVDGAYSDLQTYAVGEEWISAALGGLRIPVNAIIRRY